MSQTHNPIRELVLPVGMIASLLVILIPLPPAMIDLLLAGNITLAVIVLLSTIQVRSPLELSVFPTILLVATLGRLVLNIATTRLILTRGAESATAAAGGVIESFGQYVAGDQLIVGLIIFLIIVLVQFVVITKGATRISEVAARFSLDGLAGKQMAIDAELNTGAMEPDEARLRRRELAQQTDFFGAMDGASKFVRGDAIAGLLITLINLVGGLVIGMSQGLSLGDAVATFSMLTIGDGLASQLPAFLIAVAAALLVSRGSAPGNLPAQFLNQLARPQVLVIAGVFLILLTITKLPTVPLVIIAACCLGLAMLIGSSTQQAHVATQNDTRQGEGDAARLVEDCLSIDPIEFEMGYDLIRLADPTNGGNLLELISELRREFAEELGIVLPKVRVHDNLDLERNQYRIKIQQLPVSTGKVFPHQALAYPLQEGSQPPPGRSDCEPLTGAAASWIDESQIHAAMAAGCDVITAAEVLVRSLKRSGVNAAAKLLTREATWQLIQQLKLKQPAVVNELIPHLLGVGQVHNVLQNLLEENVSIRQFQLIMEALADFARQTTDTEQLTEKVRVRLAPYICQRLSGGGPLSVLRLAHASSELLKNQLQIANSDHEGQVNDWDQATARSIAEQILAQIESTGAQVLVVDAALRRRVRRLIARQLPQIAVLSEAEVVPGLQLQETGTLKLAA